MGDPECQVLMMRLQSDLLEVIECAIENKLDNLKIAWSNKICITIVLCSKGYPSDYVKNSEIKNLSKILTNKNNQIWLSFAYH